MIAALPDGRRQLDRTQKRHLELLRSSYSASTGEDIDFGVAVRAGEMTHILDNTQNLDVNLTEHLEGLARIL